MLSAKVFTSGNSQAVRLPKEYQLKVKELYIQKIGGALILMSKNKPWELFEKGLTEFSGDFLTDGRKQPRLPKRHLP